MIYYLVDRYREWLEANNLGFFRVFTFVTFQTTVAIVLSFVIVLAFGPRVIAWLRKQKIGDNPDFDQADINKIMEGKKGVPTMGGVLIIAAIAITTLLLADVRHNFYVQMALVCLLWLGGIGAADDWLKLTKDRRSGRDGLTEKEKLLFQVGLSVILCYFTYRHGQELEANTSLYVPFFKDVSIHLPLPVFMILGTLVITGTSNAVNLTDGLDGLAGGCMAIASVAFLVLCLLAGALPTANPNQTINILLLPYIKGSDQMAVLAAGMIGACMGFLWFNCHPAKVFMGDTGSLALGGLLGYLAIVVRQELLLVIVGGVFVMEALSVLMQRYYFKYTRLRYGEGRRIFLMSPLHHHFQKKGWPEQQIVVRFWLVGAMLAALALATIKLR